MSNGWRSRFSVGFPLFSSLLSLLLPTSSRGWAFVPPYRLPVPFALYGWASAAVVALSFIVATHELRQIPPQIVSNWREGWP
jgi:hypothetical protein